LIDGIDKGSNPLYHANINLNTNTMKASAIEETLVKHLTEELGYTEPTALILTIVKRTMDKVKNDINSNTNTNVVKRIEYSKLNN